MDVVAVTKKQFAWNRLSDEFRAANTVIYITCLGGTFHTWTLVS